MSSSKNKTILTIDDEYLIRETISDYLEELGYKVIQAENGRAGIDVFRSQKPDMVLVDLRMPEMDGLDVLSIICKESPQTPIIMVSGTGILQDAIDAIRKGAWDYVSKPIQDMAVLDYAVTRSLERAELLRENEIYKQRLEEKVHQRTKELEKSNAQLRSTLEDIVESLSILTEKRDPYTSGHQKRVSVLAALIAQEMGLSEEEITAIRFAGQLHDIGKIYVPAEFLSKPTRLDEEEMAVIRKHSVVGYEILKNIQFPWPIAETIHQHHERMDGSGYPQGLTDSDILLDAKIIAIADVVEAMSSHRPYRPALGVEKALDEIRKNQGKFYCMDCSNALLRLFEKKRNLLFDLLYS
ncbi:MAG: Response regulator receiver modulated metal dependent phosphohydrolase [Candidatus Magnetoglobus multicellularis str. Araruama]|uniref:Response regulator receiver modulated metal dependent phosphohydrolase n=1 Tax=Candidatus Magnetoglobus multicellularis str. Araruama TaxID=890399 RepID=A0A1V1PDY9_9BACT|nr:MAG: Response regulator receiver modulated metal dependent phosphohydrolase [Candidatus Magnetoglobus multicellularis str. Araruama]